MFTPRDGRERTPGLSQAGFLGWSKLAVFYPVTKALPKHPRCPPVRRGVRE